MPPRRKKPSGLTEDDVARLRSQLDEGRRPRVALSGPQFETGASGSVVRIGDPAVEGADFLTVRVKVNGVTDELAFAPAELSICRGTRPAPAGAGPAPARGRPAQPRTAAARQTASVSGSLAANPAADQDPSRATQPSPVGTDPTSSEPAGAPTKATPVPAGRRRKAPAIPAVSVTISSSGAAWSISASRGARTIVKNVPVAPGVVTAVADLLDQPGVSEAVAEINETARQQAQQRAEELRAELSDLEAVLATHRTPR
jgi:hypothetical protein